MNSANPVRGSKSNSTSNSTIVYESASKQKATSNSTRLSKNLGNSINSTSSNINIISALKPTKRFAEVFIIVLLCSLILWVSFIFYRKRQKKLADIEEKLQRTYGTISSNTKMKHEFNPLYSAKQDI
jgi:hypothetical protein